MAPGTASHPPFPVSPRALGALERLWDAGYAAYLVGGGVRDALLGRTPGDDAWDLATDARPEETLALFSGATYENRFGTVLADGVEITTFRRDHRYGDHRRPERVTFTGSVGEDLARRDFTINAIAWGKGAGDVDAGLVDTTGGRADLAAGLVRAVGDPDARFDEDALRLVRAARIAGQLGFVIEPQTREHMAAHAGDVRFLAQERVGSELGKVLRSPTPSAALRIMADTGLLEPLFPELARLHGVPQDKPAAWDVWEHTLITLDAAAGITHHDERLELAALLHDVGKPETFEEGHFIGHDQVGAEIAEGFLRRLAYPGRDAEHVVRLIRYHMFRYEQRWSDAAVRRFMRRVGVDLVDDLLRLRMADNVGSGQPADAGGVIELGDRIEAQRRDRAPLSLADLAVDGHDLQRELGREPGPWLGGLLDRLLDSVVADPARNTRQQLLADARAWASRHRS